MMRYNINGLSRQGISSVRNSDNIYMNGVFMDTFTFTRFEKDFLSEAESSLFIICGANSDNDIAKEVLREVKANVTDDNPMSGELVLATVLKIMSDADQKYAGSGNTLDVGIVVTEGNEIYAICFGEITIFSKNGDGISCLCNGTSGFALGSGRMLQSESKPVSKKLTADTRILMSTCSLAESMQIYDIEGCMELPTVKDCVGKIDSLVDIKGIQNPISVICVDMAVDEAVKAGKGFAIAMGSIIAVVVAVFIFTGVSIFGGSSDKTKNQETLKKLELESTEKADLNKAMKSVEEALNTFEGMNSEIVNIDADVKAKANEVDAILLRTGATEAELCINSAETAAILEKTQKFIETYRPKDEIMNRLNQSSDKEARKKALEEAIAYSEELYELSNAINTNYSTYGDYYTQKLAEANEREKLQQENAATNAPAKTEKAADTNKSRETKRTQSPKKNVNTQAPVAQSTPQPAAPRPATPRPATPKPATPRPATPKPATPKPATPKPQPKTESSGGGSFGLGGGSATGSKIN